MVSVTSPSSLNCCLMTTSTAMIHNYGELSRAVSWDVASRYATTTLGARIWRITFNDVVGDVPLLETCCDASEGAPRSSAGGQGRHSKAREIHKGTGQTMEGHIRLVLDGNATSWASIGRDASEFAANLEAALWNLTNTTGPYGAASVRPMPNNTNKERRVAISFHTWRKEPWRRPDTLIVERRLKARPPQLSK